MPTPDPLPGTAPDEPPPIRCRACRQPLHDPASRHWQLGPDCRRRLGQRVAPVPRGWDIEQEPLPGT